MSAALELDTTSNISANTPYGVKRSTRVTMRMTMACATFMKCSNEAKISGFFAAMPVAETPMKIENTTTAMVEVLRAPVMSRKGLVGTKLTSSFGKDKALAVSSE